MTSQVSQRDVRQYDIDEKQRKTGTTAENQNNMQGKPLHWFRKRHGKCISEL